VHFQTHLRASNWQQLQVPQKKQERFCISSEKCCHLPALYVTFICFQYINKQLLSLFLTHKWSLSLLSSRSYKTMKERTQLSSCISVEKKKITNTLTLQQKWYVVFNCYSWTKGNCKCSGNGIRLSQMESSNKFFCGRGGGKGKLTFFFSPSSERERDG